MERDAAYAEAAAIWDVAAENSVIGAILIDESAMNEVVKILHANDFYGSANRVIFSAMMALYDGNKPIDTITVASVLEARGQMEEVGGTGEFMDRALKTPSAFNVRQYAEAVKNCSVRRQMIVVAENIAQSALAGESAPIGDILNDAEGAILGIGGDVHRNEVQSAGDVLARTMEGMEAAANGEVRGILTGLSDLDAILGGMNRGDLILLAARPAMGKTALGLQLASHAAVDSGLSVAVFSLEMSSEQLMHRLLSGQTGIDSRRIAKGNLSGGDWDAVMGAANLLSGGQLFLDDTPAITLRELASKVRQHKHRYGLDLLVVDYLQLMGTDGKSFNRNREVEILSRGLKALAKELNVVILALSQLSRALESRADKHPMLSDLRDSGSLEQDADAVLFLYREDYYVEDTDRQNVADVIVAKHRTGPTGTASLYFRKETMQFGNLETNRVVLDF